MSELLTAAKKRGAQVVECGGGHFQIRGRLLVNYYPFSKKRSAYVAGTLRAEHNISPAQAVAMAFDAPPITNGTKAKRSKNAKRVRARIIARNGPNCHWCQAVLTLETSTVDHVVPIARGGLNNPNNTVLACEPCNRGRGHAMPELKA
jgi:5-methylcytosine-specific restriction endonuclease McrA